MPFLFGLVIVLLGLYIRRRLDETAAFLATRRGSGQQQALGAALVAHIREALATFGIIISGTISFYVILLYMPTFARTQLHLPLDQAFSAQAISLACMIVLIPIFGALSDRIGRRPIMMGALLLYFALTYPLFSGMYGNPSFARQGDLTLRCAIASRCFYVYGECWSFHTAKTHSGPRQSHFAVTHETAAWINDVISYRLRICRCCSSSH